MTDYLGPQLPDPSPVSLNRMCEAAAERVRSIEGSMTARLIAGHDGAPNSALLAERDAFDGIARLLQLIIDDAALRKAVTAKAAADKAVTS